MNSIRYERSWMYDRTYTDQGGLRASFIVGVDQFINFVCQQPLFLREGTVRCPCSVCHSRSLLPPNDVKVHLHKQGFKANYWYWTENGESKPVCEGSSSSTDVSRTEDHNDDETKDLPNAKAKKFYDLLDSINKPLWEGCAHSKLSTAVRLLSIKVGANIPQHSMDEIITLMRDTNLEASHLPSDFAAVKKLLSKLGLKSLKIDCCLNGCMLFYKEDANKVHCRFCGMSRYKDDKVCERSGTKISLKSMIYLPIIPRLQRLFASMTSAPYMRWHAEHKCNDGVLYHPCDGADWKTFDKKFGDFAQDPRNVRLGLCVDEFKSLNHFGQNNSCWPVILTPYNLPPDMCMTAPYMFLTCIIPGPHKPKSKIDIYLQPLIDDLLQLWHHGISTYDVSTRCNFTLRAMLMWTINDFSTYGMLSGWETEGKLACPYCMEKTKAFTLSNAEKSSWFDCHRQFLHPDHPFRRFRNKFRASTVETDLPIPRPSGEDIYKRVKGLSKITSIPQLRIFGHGATHKWTKRSIFWDLPYWKDNLVRHNLDVMQIEKNIFKNICNTVMDVKDKTKDNVKARRDIEKFCNRPDLHLVDSGNGRNFYKPKAIYTFTREQKNMICRWVIKTLRFPDSYAFNLARCVDMAEAKFQNLKSYDCHVLMQYLLPIMFKSLPKHVWEAISDLSTFFKDICSSKLRVPDIYTLEGNIPGILCALEMIFPPEFFDIMEHLPIHTTYEAWAGGPVQYRWMYPFERFLEKLKWSITQKGRIESLICQTYLCHETSHFMSYYFVPHVDILTNRISKNYNSGVDLNVSKTLSIFNQPGRASGACKVRWFTDQEQRASHLHVLINCKEVHPFIKNFQDQHNIQKQLEHPLIQDVFPNWFREYVHDGRNNVTCPHLRDLAYGPLRQIRTFNRYFANGYEFHTATWSCSRKTNNCGVYIKGKTADRQEDDYYGIINDIIEVEYPAEPIKRVVLFSCTWYDQTINVGRRVHQRFKIVEVNSNSRSKHYDPFVVAQNATQVYFLPYPEKKSETQDWRVAIKMHPNGQMIIDDALEVALQEDISQVIPITEYKGFDRLVDASIEPEAVEIVPISKRARVEEEDVDNTRLNTDSDDEIDIEDSIDDEEEDEYISSE